MTPQTPHFLLFSDASRDAIQAGRGERWQFVLESSDGGFRLAADEEEPNVSGERLELLALVRGLEALDQPSRVTVVTQSRYVRQGLAYGIDEWRESGWRWERFGQMTPVKNCDLWQRVDRALQFHRVECRLWRVDGAHRTPAEAKRAATSPPLWRRGLKSWWQAIRPGSRPQPKPAVHSA